MASLPEPSPSPFFLPDPVLDFDHLDPSWRLPPSDIFALDATLDKLPPPLDAHAQYYADELHLLSAQAQMPALVNPPAPAQTSVPIAMVERDEDTASTQDTSVFSVASPRDVSRPSSCGAKRSIKKRASAGAGACAETRRLQHNRMMRANRERANRKFAALEALMQRCRCAEVGGSVPKNKMQVLDRAMAQYPAMRTRRALLRAQLLTAADPPPLEVDDPATLARLLMALYGWKAAEVWHGGEMQAALLSHSNTLQTADSLRTFCKQRAVAGDKLVARARAQANIWVPDMRMLSAGATEGGVSTALYVPLADNVVVVLLHADDEQRSYAGGIRPYDTEMMAKVDGLARRLR